MAAVREFAGDPGPDIFLAPVIEEARSLIAGRKLRTAIEREVGALG